MKWLLLDLIEKHYQLTVGEYPYYKDYVWRVWVFEFIIRDYFNGSSSDILVFVGGKFLVKMSTYE